MKAYDNLLNAIEHAVYSGAVLLVPSSLHYLMVKYLDISREPIELNGPNVKIKLYKGNLTFRTAFFVDAGVVAEKSKITSEVEKERSASVSIEVPVKKVLVRLINIAYKKTEKEVVYEGAKDIIFQSKFYRNIGDIITRKDSECGPAYTYYGLLWDSCCKEAEDNYYLLIDGKTTFIFPFNTNAIGDRTVEQAKKTFGDVVIVEGVSRDPRYDVYVGFSTGKKVTGRTFTMNLQEYLITALVLDRVSPYITEPQYLFRAVEELLEKLGESVADYLKWYRRDVLHPTTLHSIAKNITIGHGGSVKVDRDGIRNALETDPYHFVRYKKLISPRLQKTSVEHEYAEVG